jgi:hypothetical protein
VLDAADRGGGVGLSRQDNELSGGRSSAHLIGQPRGGLANHLEVVAALADEVLHPDLDRGGDDLLVRRG